MAPLITTSISSTRTPTRTPTRALSFPPKCLDQFCHLPSSLPCIYLHASHTHADLLIRVAFQQPVEHKIPHHKTHVYAAVASVLLLRRVLKVYKLELSIQEDGELLAGLGGRGVVGGIERIVVESDVVQKGDKEERPVGAAFD